VRCWDYVARRELFSSAYANAATCLAWAPAALDSQARTIIVGFEDGVVRALYRAQNAWIRIQSLKPHNGPLTALQISADGKFLATGGGDGSVFLMECSEFTLDSSVASYKPIGFCQIAEPIQSLSWQSDSLALLITCKDGRLYELEVHGNLEPETAGSFKLSASLHIRTLEHPRDDAPRETADDESTQSPQQHIAHAVYSSQGDRVLATLGPNLPGLVLDVGIKQPTDPCYRSIGAQTGSDQSNICFLQYSHGDRYLIAARDDGATTFSPMPHESIALRIQTHDGNTRITGACLSHDDNFALTGGTDGLIVVSRVILQHLEAEFKEESPLQALTLRVPTKDGMEFRSDDARYPAITSDAQDDLHDKVKENSFTSPDDIQSGAYSLEDARLKLDEDACRVAAERKKEGLRKIILHMRRDFEELERENGKLPLECRLTNEELLVDSEYFQILEKQADRFVEDLRCEHLQRSEEAKSRLRQYKDHFLRNLQRHNNSVMKGQSMRALRLSYCVGSFRTSLISGALKQQLNQVHVFMRDGDIAGPHLIKSQETIAHKEHEKTESTAAAQNQSMPIEVASRQSTLEYRKVMRAQRKANLQAMLQKKPTADMDDPRDVDAIEKSKMRLGDYKLKSSLHYKVPRDKQVNASTKRQQMMVLQENINSIKGRYNMRFLALRDVKAMVFQSIIHCDKQCRSLELSCAKLVGDSTIDHAKREKLKFPISMMIDPSITAQINSAEEWPDVALTAHEDAAPYLGIDTPPHISTAKNLQHGYHSSTEVLSQLPVVRNIPDAKLVSERSPIQQHTQWRSANRLHHESILTFSRTQDHIGAFDRALCELRKEFVPLSSDLKVAELRLLLLLKVRS